MIHVPDLGFFSRQLDTLRRQALYREPVTLESGCDREVLIGGRPYLNACSNNYLGLSGHPEIRQAAIEAAMVYGCGTGGSRLLGGSQILHARLEEAVLRMRPLGAALLFNSGYQANIAAIQALAPHFRIVLADKLVHASLVDGMRLAGAPFRRYRHGDMDMLEALLRKQPSPRECLVATETLFSMDGDFAPLDDLLFLQSRYGFFLYLDEAHSTGCYPGLLDGVLSQAPDRLIVMGTFGKAFGSFGAYLASAAPVVEYLINKARGFVFSTSLPPPVLAASLKALEVADRERQRAEELAELARHAMRALRGAGADVGASRSHILPVILGSDERAMGLAAFLLSQGIYTQAVRHPTVPRGTARLRFNLRADMLRGDVDRFASLVGKGLPLLPENPQGRAEEGPE